MSVRPEPIGPVPEDTARVAKAAFPKGNLYVRRCSGVRGRRRPPGVAVVRCEVRSPVQQVAEFLEAAAERALFARRDDQGAAFEDSR